MDYKKLEPKPKSREWRRLVQIWHKMLPPSRPSMGCVRIFGKFILQSIRNKKSCRALVLGATPEIRNLLLKYSLFRKIVVFLVDLNPEMIRAMDEFVEINSHKEKKIVSNWLAMPFKNEYFDLVLGDEVFINVAQKDRDKLLREVWRVLKPQGVFIVRASHINFKAKNFNVKKSINKYSKLYLQNRFNLSQIMNYLLEELLEASYFRNKKGLISLKFLEKDCYKELKSPNPINRLIMKTFIDEYRPLFRQYWSWESKSDQLKRFNKYFQIKKIKVANDYPYFNILPIYYLIKIN